MSRDEVVAALKATVNKPVLIVFVDGSSQSMIIVNTNHEGFVNKIGDEFFWTTFDEVADVRADSGAPLYTNRKLEGDVTKNPPGTEPDGL